MTEEKLVEFGNLDTDGAVKVARLVREKPLNSLLLDTINQLAEKIYAWLDDDSVHCIVLDSSSDRAFCAGADITALYHSIREAGGGDNPYAEAFFRNEYQLNYALHTAKKPIVVWGHGIVMGGGLGLLGGCSHRIGTSSTRIAMPEITIGLFPDAGGTRFLSRLPDHFGLFAGLTGCQMSAGDALSLGLLDVVVDTGSKAAIFDGLAGIEWQGTAAEDGARITRLLEGHRTSETLPYHLLGHREAIRHLITSCLHADDFFAAFDPATQALPHDEWLETAINTYRNGSAVTARVFFEQMRRARDMSLEDMFRMEFVIACQCIRHPDFPEGVRALLIDKDRRPKWSYATATEVPEAVVQQHFEPTWRGENPLQFRS